MVARNRAGTSYPPLRQGALSLGKQGEAGAKDPSVELRLEGDGKERLVRVVQIEFLGKPVYVALLADRDIWCEEDVGEWPAQKPTELAWKRPFEAKWRANFLGKEGAWSRDMFSGRLSIDVMFEGAPAKWQGDIPTVSLQGLWPYFIYPFWMHKGRMFVALYADMDKRKAAEGENRAGRPNS